MKRDFLICGAGLAGCLLAWELSKQGKSFLLVDNLSDTGSSQVAAGIINPITGKRFVLIENFASLFNTAQSCYQEIEETLDQSFLKKIPIIRIFKDAKEHQFYNEERQKPEQQTYLKQFNPAGVYRKNIKDLFGSLVFDGYHVAGADLIAALRHHFKESLRDAVFYSNDMRLNGKGISWQGEDFHHLIFCEGFAAQQNPYFDWIPFKSAKGELLLIETEEASQPEGLLNFGKWMQPLGNSRWRVGATFHWENINNKPSEIGLTELTQALDQYSTSPYQIIQHVAGVRPVVRDLKPLLGTHPEHPQLSIFNGLGAKGFLYAPTYVRMLTDHLLSEKNIPPQLSIARFLD